VDNLGISKDFLGGSIALITLPLLGTMATGKYVGRLIDRHGVKPVLWWGHRLWALIPAFWLFATPKTALWWLAAGSLIGGGACSAAINAANKLTTRLPQREHVAMYVAVSTCIGSLAAAMGSGLAGLILYLLRDFSLQVGPVTVVGFHVIFVASFAIRNLSTIVIPYLTEPEERTSHQEAMRPAEATAN
jgi:MFS family permease